MRYLAFLLAFLVSVAAYAQQYKTHFPTGSEKYFCLDTSLYFNKNPLTDIRDSLAKLQKAAKAAGDDEFVVSLNLFIYIKAYNTHLVSSDTTEYRLLRLAADANEKKMKRVEADALQALGNLYSINQQQNAAIEQYTSAYSIYKHFSPDEYPYKQENIYQTGLTYYKYQEYEIAIKYLREALHLNQATKSNLFPPIANTIGLCYRNMKLYDSAILYFQKIYDIAVKQNYPVWIGISQGNIGITYFYQKKYAEAEPLLKKDIEYGLARSNIKNVVSSLTILATIYYEQSKYDEAEKLLLRALSLCHQKSFWQDCTIAEKIYELLHKAYGNRGQYRLSNLYADSALLAKDSVMNRYNALSLSKSYEKQNFIRKKLEAERHENRAKLNQLKKLDQQQLLYKFIIGFLFVVLMVAIMVNRYRTDLRKIVTDVQDAPEIVVQKMSIVIISIATCVAAVIWGLLYYYYYRYSVATLGPIIYFIIIGPSLIVYFLFKKQQFLINAQLICIFSIPVLMQMTAGGFQSGVVINWAVLAPVGALMYKGIKEAAFWMILLVIAVICTIVFNEYFLTFYRPISPVGQSMFYGMDILGPTIVIYFCMQFFVKSMIRDGRLLQENNLILSKTLGELKQEKQKSDDLLLNILPGEVADELKTNGTTTARHFDNVTVLFTDFVNFTSAGERMSPQNLIDELHSCFKMFDEITGEYNIEKIKTIGDAYLAVAGLPTADPKHAENVVRASIKINRYMQEKLAKPGNNTFEIRIGIHSGSVVAGVVGVKKFAYDIWGDAVNTAARMEQNSESGRINISQTTYELIKDKIPCIYRGEVEAKGKGMLKMYFVE